MGSRGDGYIKDPSERMVPKQSMLEVYSRMAKLKRSPRKTQLKEVE